MLAERLTDNFWVQLKQSRYRISFPPAKMLTSVNQCYSEQMCAMFVDGEVTAAEARHLRSGHVPALPKIGGRIAR
jgi:hypothetical protein